MEKFLIVSITIIIIFTLIMCSYFSYFCKMGALDTRRKKIKGALLWVAMMPLILLALLIPIKAIQELSLDIHRLIGILPFIISVMLSLIISKEKVTQLMKLEEKSQDQ